MKVFKKVLYLVGGTSVERAVSEDVSALTYQTLVESGYQVQMLDVKEPIRDTLQEIMASDADVVLNGLYGGTGEDGSIQGFLNLLRIPYTHSGVLGSALGMDKEVSLNFAASQGVMVPEGKTASVQDIQSFPPAYPFVIKPLNEGSSVGVFVIHNQDDLMKWAQGLSKGTPPQRVEAWIPGHEITVVVMNGKAVESAEVKPFHDFYDYASKYQSQETRYIIPAQLPESIQQQAFRVAERVHEMFSCRGVTRADFRYNPEAPEGQQLFFLETNTQPGPMLIPKMLAKHGWSRADLLTWMIENAAYDSELSLEN